MECECSAHLVISVGLHLFHGRSTVVRYMFGLSHESQLKIELFNSPNIFQATLLSCWSSIWIPDTWVMCKIDQGFFPMN